MSQMHVISNASLKSKSFHGFAFRFLIQRNYPQQPRDREKRKKKKTNKYS